MLDFTWYNELIKPPFSPPSWIFAPVWAVLYIIIIVSFLLFVVKQSACRKTEGYAWFFVQILLNLLWTPAFFLLKNIGLALAIVILMDIAVFSVIRKFYCVSRLASIMLIPYFTWILYATYLNRGFYLLNR